MEASACGSEIGEGPEKGLAWGGIISGLEAVERMEAGMESELCWKRDGTTGEGSGKGLA